MNESTLIQLKIIVERAVRPVRASMSRKRKMREELLAHVCGVFEEESARRGDERIVLEQTAQRFGIPGELTGQLQESVPASDVFHRFMEWAWFRPDESIARRGLRFAFLQALVLILFLPIWYVWVQVSGWLTQGSDWPMADTLFGGSVLLFDFFFFTCAYVILVWGLVKADHKMASRIRMDQEWANFQIDPEGRV